MASYINREKIEKIAKQYAELVKTEISIDSVYLYGSYAKGTDSEDSDIDIAVVGEDFIGDPVEDTLKLMKLRRKIDKRIEPHPFKSIDFDISNPYVLEIINTGIRII